jgi:pantoate--beta-alanine ligase
VREPDGLACSSRNAYLSAEERARAAALRRALDAAEAAVSAGERDAASVRELALAALRPYGVELDYLEVVSPATLEPLEEVDGDALVVVAARVGRTRLIDNATVRAPAHAPARATEKETACSA